MCTICISPTLRLRSRRLCALRTNSTRRYLICKQTLMNLWVFSFEQLGNLRVYPDRLARGQIDLNCNGVIVRGMFVDYCICICICICMMSSCVGLLFMNECAG